MNLPFLVFSDSQGKIYNHPFLRIVGSSGGIFSLPKKQDLIVLPKGSTLFSLPGRLACGFNPATNNFETIEEFAGKKVFSCAAFLIPAFLRLLNPAYIIKEQKTLPLWAYTAVGFYHGKFYCSAQRIDNRVRQSPAFYNNHLVKQGIDQFYRQYPNNRLYAHLANCALNYNCLAAKNLFLKRWEAPLPTARFCNARCLGCLSDQKSKCGSSHQRINFSPDSEEIAQVAINHLTVARQAIVSFGQGCEGEPLLEAKVIAGAVKLIRQATNRGTINMNTNGGLPEKVELLCQVGIDSFRISLNSPQEKFYNAYFRPSNYKFSDVVKSIAIARKHKKFISFNLFIFPGFSDDQRQIAELVKFLHRTQPNMIQWRNLNIDPDYYRQHIDYPKLKPQGVRRLVAAIKKTFPKIKHGYFNPFGV
jgi:pyruvate-formate lyase-activating enzyme